MAAKTTLELQNQVIKLFNEGFNVTKISNLLKLDFHNVSRIIKRNGYTFSKCNKYNIDSNIFKIVDNEEKAYWLGFLYADGYVSSKKNIVELTLKESDTNHLEKFKQFLKFEGRITQNKKQKSSRITFKDNEISQDLIKLGCVPNKSLILTFPTENQVPNHLIHHFIRGYFDGDGCINDYKNPIAVSILGTFNFLNNILNLYNLQNKKIKKENNIHFIVLNGENARNFLNVLYSNCNICLNRKFERFTNHINQYKKWIDKNKTNYKKK